MTAAVGGEPPVEEPQRMVGVRVGIPTGDAAGIVLGEFDDGWQVMATHISSHVEWARSDLAYHVARLRDEYPSLDLVDYEFVGCMTHEDMHRAYPPSTTTADPGSI